jgi:hypothetical protein
MPDWREHIRQVLTELAIDPAREEEVVAELVQHLDDRYGHASRGRQRRRARHGARRVGGRTLLVAELMR